MLIGVPKEIKNHEYRVSISPQGVRELVFHGHQVYVQKDAGAALGFDDTLYQESGALILDSAEAIYEKADMIVKVKEPQIQECQMIRDGQIIFCYLHLAADAKIAAALIERNCIAIAYETVTDTNGRLPLLEPMSEIAGRVAVQAAARSLENSQGGRGVLLSGAPGVERGRVTVLGGGAVGTSAALIAAGMGANVTILDNSLTRLRELSYQFNHSRVDSIFSTTESIEQAVTNSDVVIGGVLIPGSSAPKLVSEEMVRKMKRGSVIVDVAIDQGGCIETSKPTTHDEPTYIVHEVVHYCVTNMPSAVARTATQALENATLPYIISLANNGYRSALKENTGFRQGLNVYRGRVTHEAVAINLNQPYVPPTTFLGG